jgi:hypothetical protein
MTVRCINVDQTWTEWDSPRLNGLYEVNGIGFSMDGLNHYYNLEYAGHIIGMYNIKYFKKIWPHMDLNKNINIL